MKKGSKHTAEARAKMSKALRANNPMWRSEIRAKLSAQNKGKSSRGRGWTVSEETKAKMSAAQKGRKMSSEHRANLIETMKNPEIRAKISAACKGRKFTDEHRANLSKTHKGKGHKQSPETRAKISASRKGICFTTKHKANISAALKGKPGRKHNPETKAKIGKVHKGKKVSVETRAKISAALKGRTPLRTNPAETAARISAAKKGKPLPWLRMPEIQEKARRTWQENGRTSKGQKRLYEILNKVNVVFESEYYFRLDGTWAFADAFIPSCQLDIEYDGHQIHRTPSGKTKDAERDAKMLSIHGINTLRIGRKEIFTDAGISKIAAAIGASQ